MTRRRENQHGTIESYKLANGSERFRVRVRVGGRLVTVKSALSSRPQAEEYAKAYRTIQSAKALRRGMALSEFGVTFFEEREARGLRDVPNERNRWGNHVEDDPLGRIPLSAISRADIVGWLARLEKKRLARQTTKNIFNLVRSALQEALDRELVERNVASDVKIRRTRATVSIDDLDGVLDPAEQKRLMAACLTPAQAARVALCLLTGVRLSEAVWLRWDDVDLAKKQIRVRTSRKGKATKSGIVRRVPILDPLLPILESLPRSSEWVLPGRRGGRSPEGKPLIGSEDWKALKRRAGITRRVRWHDLRHTCATSLLGGWWRRSWDLKEVCKFLGHSSVQVTERYARKLDSMAKEAAEGTFQQSSTGLIGDALDRGVFRGAIHQNRTDDLRFTKTERDLTISRTSVGKSSLEGTFSKPESSGKKARSRKAPQKGQKVTEGQSGDERTGKSTK